MKIAFVTNSTQTMGGATKALRSLIDRLRSVGVEPIVIVNDHEGIYQTWQEDGIEMIALDYREAIRPDLNKLKDYILLVPRILGRRWLSHRASTKLGNIIKEKGIDLVHTNVSVVDIGYMAAKKAGVPHVYHVREYGDKDFFMHYYPSRKAVDRRIARGHSICITQDIQHYHGLSNNVHSHVIYDGVLPQKEECPPIGEATYFLLAGRVEPGKGIDFMLRGYASYAKRTKTPIPVWIAGDCYLSDYFEAQKQFIQREGIEHLVRFLGLRKDIHQLMQNARATIVASCSEGFGFCMTEAMFNGCIVIGRDLAGTHEQFENGRSATGEEIGLRYKTETELANHLETVANTSNTELEHMRQKAFSVVNTLYTSEKHASEVYKTYCNILSAND